MAQEVFLRTAAGIISADKFDDHMTPYKPVRHARSAVFVREESPLTAQTTPATNSTVRWEVNKSGDYIDKVWLNGYFAQLQGNAQVGGASATIVRWTNWLCYSAIKEIRVLYGSQVLQRIHKEELYLWHKNWLDDEEQAAMDFQVLGNVSDPQRNINAIAGPLYFKMPLHTLWLHQTENQAMLIQGMANKIAFEFDFEAQNKLVQANGTWAIGGVVSPSEQASFSASQCFLTVEYVHVTQEERRQVVDLYADAQGVRYLITDFQMHPGDIVPQATSLTTAGPYQLKLLNITQPVYAMFTMFRWANDYNRIAPPSTPTQELGRDCFNVGGWYQPAYTPQNPSTPLVGQIDMKSNNNYLVKLASIQDFIWEKKKRFFKGTPGAGSFTPLWSYSHGPTIPNSTFGSIDFSVVDQPIIEYYWNINPNGAATIGAYSALDINESSDLRIDVIAATYNNVDILNYDAIRPFN